MNPLTQINWTNLLLWLVPPMLRQPAMMAWLRAVTQPIVNRYKLFTVWEADCWYQLKYQSGQVAHLEFMLNDKFDKAQKRIFISGGVILSRLYLYLDSELQPMWTYRDVEQMPLWMYSDAELAAGYGADFVIHVPFGLVAQDDTVQAFADRYKRDGKSYDYVKF